jgi:hypothetical protein
VTNAPVSDDLKPASWWKRRNWWRIAFFTVLIAFEVTRELFVLSMHRPLRRASPQA